ncbi:SMRP1 protein, partial [Galbula dea]|nr:SMRP1 protein [Galbula dea]
MFLFSKKHKTPTSTYTDSYRPPCSLKKAFEKKTSQQKENNFVTQGLTVPPEQKLGIALQPKQMITAATQTCYRNTIDTAACRPGKYWLDRSEERYNPVFVNEDKYISWRTGPYNSTAWNKHSSNLPLPHKEARMETFLHSMPVPYPLRPTCLHLSESDVLRRLPAYTVRGREPFQGCCSLCSACHCGLRGMDCCAGGTPGASRHLHTLEETALRSVPRFSYSPRAMVCASTHHPQPSFQNCSTSPRWDTSHFMMAGGVQRGSYIIHPEFTSEAHSALRR